MKKYDNNGFDISLQHAELLKQILENDATIEKFKEKYSDIQSFVDISNIIREVTDTAPMYTCDQCESTFDTKNELKSHKQSHNSSQSYTCDKCNKPFSSQEDLRRHQQARHAAQRFPCPTCGSDVYFSTQQELDAHMKRKHNSLDANTTR